MTDAIFFDSRAAAAACVEFSFSHRKTRSPLPSPDEMQALRREAVSKGAVYVQGRQGMRRGLRARKSKTGYRPLGGFFVAYRVTGAAIPRAPIKHQRAGAQGDAR